MASLRTFRNWDVVQPAGSSRFLMMIVRSSPGVSFFSKHQERLWSFDVFACILQLSCNPFDFQQEFLGFAHVVAGLQVGKFQVKIADVFFFGTVGVHEHAQCYVVVPVFESQSRDESARFSLEQSSEKVELFGFGACPSIHRCAKGFDEFTPAVPLSVELLELDGGELVQWCRCHLGLSL